MKLIPCSLLAVAFVLAGCSRDTELRNALGDFQYMGKNPKVTVQVLKRDYLKAQSEYGTAKLRLTGVMKQEGEFPVKDYAVAAILRVNLGKKEVGKSFTQDVIMKGGNAAFSVEIPMYELSSDEKGKLASDGSALAVALADFNWWPVRNGLKTTKLIQ